MVKIVKFLVRIISEYLSKSNIPDVSNWNCWTLFGWKIEVGIGIGGRAHWPHAPPTHSGYAPVIRWTSILLVSLNNWIKNLEDINYYHNHISIEKIKSSNNNIQTLFTFNLASSDEIKRYILTLNNKKASREGDITVNILKDATDNYLPILRLSTPQLNRMNFQMNWKWLIFSLFTKMPLLIKKIIGLWAYCQLCLRFLRDFCISKLKHLRVINYQPSYLAFVKTIIHNIA